MLVLNTPYIFIMTQKLIYMYMYMYIRFEKQQLLKNKVSVFVFVVYGVYVYGVGNYYKQFDFSNCIFICVSCPGQSFW